MDRMLRYAGVVYEIKTFVFYTGATDSNKGTHYKLLISIDNEAKNDAVVKITLPENNKSIVASKYQLYLPSEQQLLDELKSGLDKAER